MWIYNVNKLVTFFGRFTQIIPVITWNCSNIAVYCNCIALLVHWSRFGQKFTKNAKIYECCHILWTQSSLPYWYHMIINIILRFYIIDDDFSYFRQMKKKPHVRFANFSSFSHPSFMRNHTWEQIWCVYYLGGHFSKSESY